MAGFDLIIVESPNKVKTLMSFLDKKYKVAASVGHICEIKNTGLYNLGIDVKGDFDIDFVVSSDKKEVVKNLKGLVQKADTVYVATDPD